MGDDRTPAPPAEKDFYEVPAGTIGKPCRLLDCDRTKFMIPSPKTPGAWIPIDCDVEGGKRPTPIEPGRGISHFKTCKRPSAFHRAKPLSDAEIEARHQKELPVSHTPPSCLFCGCTPLRACILTIAEAGLEADEIPLGEDSQPVRFVGCSWFSTEPPICSAPVCLEKFTALPLAERLEIQVKRTAASRGAAAIAGGAS